MNTAVQIPPGCREDHRGRWIPEAQIQAIDQARDALVMEIVRGAREQSAALAAFKRRVFDDIAAFVELSAEQYGVRLGGNKGNVSLTSFDGRYKVMRAVAETIVFDERLQAAKELIDTCLNEWVQGARPELKALVSDAFRVDQAGNIRVQEVLGLRRLKIEDERWQRAMLAIADAVQVVGSKCYLRVYERVDGTASYRQIPLDVSAVSTGGAS